MNDEMTLGQWVATLVISAIPCVGIIMLFVWAFGNGQYVARKRWAQAQLIICAVVIVLCLILLLFSGASILALKSHLANTLIKFCLN